MGYLRRKTQYKTSAELDKTLSDASQFYSDLRRRVAEEDGLDPDEAAINPELSLLRERYGDRMPGKIPGHQPRDLLNPEARSEGRTDEMAGDISKASPPYPRPATRKPTTERRKTKPQSKKAVKRTTTGQTRPSPRPGAGMAGRLVTLELPEGLLKGMDEYIEAGEYSSRDDFIKEAVRDKLRTLRK